jgi:hypothetical protein
MELMCKLSGQKWFQYNGEILELIALILAIILNIEDIA